MCLVRVSDQFLQVRNKDAHVTELNLREEPLDHRQLVVYVEG